MDHRLRVLDALHHRQPDRPPRTLGSPSCSLHRKAHERLIEFLTHRPTPGPSLEGGERREVRIIDSLLQIVEPDPRLIEYFDIDLVWLLPNEIGSEWSPDGQRYRDEFGRSFIAGGEFFNQVEAPLRQGTLEELKAYRFPDLSRPERYAGLQENARRLHTAGYGLGVDGPWGIYEISSSLRGTANYLMDLAANPGYAAALAERVLEEHHLPFYTRLLQETAPYVQMAVISDDLGSQQGLLFSPRTFRTIFKPLLRRLVEHIHALADVKVYMHSDGAVSALLPDLIEIGVEGLNPVQYTAKGMALEKLKAEFGRDLGFFGGTVENEVLSYATPEEVRALTRRNVEILAPGGGFIFAPIHNISPEVPAENVVALFKK